MSDQGSTQGVFVDPNIELAAKFKHTLEEKGIPKQYVQRVDAELKSMIEMDVIRELKAHYDKIQEHPELRGSENKPNSLVGYLLGITTKAPDDEFRLEKRRTYGRAGFPDIDMDFDYERRHEIEAYLRQKYGDEYVGQIGTIQTLKTKAAVRRVIKVLDPDKSIIFDASGKAIRNEQSENFALQNSVMRTIPNMMKRADGTPVKTVKEAYETWPEFREQMDKYPEVYRIAQRMEGSISAFGCLAKDTTINTDAGDVRIDQVSPSFCSVAYLDRESKKRYTKNYVAHKTGIKKCYRLRLINGDWIKVTDEHLIFTDQGIVLFEEIRKNPQKYKVMSVKNLNTDPAACQITPQEVSRSEQM